MNWFDRQSCQHKASRITRPEQLKMSREYENKRHQAYRLAQLAPNESGKASRRDEAEKDEMDE
jgi:hypothetical protein